LVTLFLKNMGNVNLLLRSEYHSKQSKDNSDCKA